MVFISPPSPWQTCFEQEMEEEGGTGKFEYDLLNKYVIRAVSCYFALQNKSEDETPREDWFRLSLDLGGVKIVNLSHGDDRIRKTFLMVYSIHRKMGNLSTRFKIPPAGSAHISETKFNRT